MFRHTDRATSTGALAIGWALIVASACFGQNQYRASIVVEGGGSLPSTPLFTFPPGGWDLPRCRILNAFANGVVIYEVPVDRNVADMTDKCAVTIWLKGFQKAGVALHDGAVITLKQIGDPEGSTVSVTALHVPKEAAKAYDKGLAAMTNGKLPDAQKEFERAVALYPEYAQAWSQLAEVLEQEARPKEAADACEHALQADAKYIRPYLQLMRLAVLEKRMEHAAALGERALKLDPVEFPGIYYYDAVANYALKHLEVAERVAREGIELDKDRQYPAAEALLGWVLADKGDARGAIDHLTKYLQLAPKAAAAPAIRERIRELERAQTP